MTSDFFSQNLFIKYPISVGPTADEQSTPFAATPVESIVVAALVNECGSVSKIQDPLIDPAVYTKRDMGTYPQPIIGVNSDAYDYLIYYGYRGYAYFDITTLHGLVAATAAIEMKTAPNPVYTSTLQLREIAFASQSSPVTLWDDVLTGSLLGSRNLFDVSPNQVFQISLNATGIAALNAAIVALETRFGLGIRYVGDLSDLDALFIYFASGIPFKLAVTL